MTLAQVGRGMLSTTRLINPAMKPLLATRPLSISIPKYTEVKEDLLQTLSGEIEEEKRQAQEEGGQRPAVQGFTFSSKDAVVTLTKKHGNEEIRVEFDVSHSVDPDSEEFDDEGALPESRPPVLVEVIKGDKKLCFDLNITLGEEADKYDFTVDEFYLTDAKEKEVPNHVYRSSGGFIDPALGELLFKRYLEERGVNDAFLAELVKLSTFHEHEQYVKMLRELKDFIAK